MVVLKCITEKKNLHCDLCKFMPLQKDLYINCIVYPFAYHVIVRMSFLELSRITIKLISKLEIGLLSCLRSLSPGSDPPGALAFHDSHPLQYIL